MRWHRLAFWGAFPLLLPQGLWLRATATRLPPAPGPRSGSVGQGQRRRVLVLGDSVVAGVGAASVAEALAGRFAASLASRWRAEVCWEAVGESGARIATVHGELLGQAKDVPLDAILLSVGLNDVTGLTRSGSWRERLGSLLDDLAERHDGARIVLAGIPPLRHFPAIPQPLRQVLALRGDTFDAISAAVCAERAACRFVPTDLVPDPDDFATDGFHPGPRGYAGWGERLAEAAAAGQERTEPR